GRWSVMLFMDSLTGQQVKRPTIGMEGYVIDHFREAALSLFLDAVGNRTVNELRTAADPPSIPFFATAWKSMVLTGRHVLCRNSRNGVATTLPLICLRYGRRQGLKPHTSATIIIRLFPIS